MRCVCSQLRSSHDLAANPCCHVCSRRQKRSKLKELNASCIWRITPTPSPSPERSASPAANGDAARCAHPSCLQLAGLAGLPQRVFGVRLPTSTSAIHHCAQGLRQPCHAGLLQEGEEAGGQGSGGQRQRLRGGAQAAEAEAAAGAQRLAGRRCCCPQRAGRRSSC
jgi:hypothetical protein